MAKIQTVAKTHVGQVRDHNEDTFIVGLDPVSDVWVLSFDEQEVNSIGAVFVVADGMGGENAGEIASEIAVQSIRTFIQAELRKEEVLPLNKILESSLIYAHNCIKDACRDNADYIGMGTTATVCMIQNDRLYVTWIGDSRVYRYSKHGRVHALPFHYNNLDILSEDHSKVWQMMRQGQISLEEARTHQESNIITQSLGDLFRTPQPESREYPIFKDDHILICSDGLNGMLSDPTIERIFTAGIETLDKMAEQMIIEANLAGGHDNITLILTKVTDGLPYSEEIVQKGGGEKTVKTEILTKKNFNFWNEIIIIGVACLLCFFAWQNKEKINGVYKNWRTPSDSTVIDSKTIIRQDSVSNNDKGEKSKNNLYIHPKPSENSPEQEKVMDNDKPSIKNVPDDEKTIIMNKEPIVKPAVKLDSIIKNRPDSIKQN
ncbi:MAG: serine/threonine-protein phosphatase [Saprospiraceae bacterium]|jgi:protein phosphatase|nr:serine/threonine-protein phosphatase [Saprospiraceae bacterium]MBK8829238.1 serine/threonine-protein phosphatase [Saprospiraceae bacterium]MBK8888050.1 serine/threonine-protein phosphatase [Saprospiraceae bacterium]